MGGLSIAGINVYLRGASVITGERDKKCAWSFWCSALNPSVGRARLNWIRQRKLHVGQLDVT